MRIRNHRSYSSNCISTNVAAAPQPPSSHKENEKEKEKDEEEGEEEEEEEEEEPLTMDVVGYRGEWWAERGKPQPCWGDDGLSDLDVNSMDQHKPVPMPKVIGKEPPEAFRVCRLNKSPWDVPSFFRAFDSHWTNTVDSSNMTTPSPLPVLHNQEKPKQTSDVKDETLLNKSETSTLRVVKEAKLAHTKGGFVKLNAEEVLIESALRSVFSEAGDGGLTVREAACKLLLEKHNNNNNNNNNNNSSSSSSCYGNSASGSLPLSVQARRVMLNSPYFAQLKDGRFALWGDFLKISEEESCNNIKPCDLPAAASPHITKIKGKRSARVGCMKQQKAMGMGVLKHAGQQKKESDEYEYDNCEWATSQCNSERRRQPEPQNKDGSRGVKKARKAMKARSLRSLV